MKNDKNMIDTKIPFLYSVPNVMTNEVCKQYIDAFEKSTIKKEVDYRLGDGSIHKKSTDIYFKNDTKSDWYIKEKYGWYDLFFELNNVLNYHLKEYYNLYPELNQLPMVECMNFNVQKYKPGEGFGGWHFESSYGDGERKLVWMIYLNDLEDGGTEFKYQNHRENAEMGKLLIWPADWTFTHRGQISNTTTKYILTGWFEDIKYDE